MTTFERDREISEAVTGWSSEIRGFADSFSPDRLAGWAWSAARPDECLTVELRLDGTTVASVTANLPRPDLVKARIGDGNHAFEMPLTPVWAKRKAEFSVVARAADGTETPITIREQQPRDSGFAGLQHAVEALAAGQRLQHEEVRIVAASQLSEQVEALRGLVAAQRDLATRLDLMSMWLTRLDKRLAALEEAMQPLLLRRGLDARQIVLTVVLAAVGSAALASAVLVLGR